jgi:hypothetical protein
MTPQLDDQTREALSALDQPPPGVEDRLFAAILQTTGGGGDGGGSQLPIGGGESALAYVAKVVGATLGLTAAGFALVAASAVGVRSLRETPERTSTPSSSPADITSPSTDGTAELPTAVDTEPASASDPPDPASASPGQASAPARNPSGTAKSNAALSPTPTLEAELALLEVARGAAPHAALAALERHRVEFEHGMLADEREVLRVENLCALGRASEAEVIASTFVAARPHSPLRSRIEGACKGKSDSRSPG